MFKKPFSANPTTDLLVRLLFALPLMAVGMGVLYAGTKGSAMGALFVIPVAALFFALGGVFLAPWVAERVADPVGNLFMPDRRFDRPQPMYSIAEGKRARCEFAEAMAQYEDILVQHPGDLRCYIAMMDIAATDLRDPELAESIYRRAIHDIERKKDRETLKQAHEELLSDYH